jgi:hypothetical protein
MSWTDIEAKGKPEGEGGGSKIEYVSFPPNTTTRGRVLDAEPKSRWVHWIPQACKGKGTSVNCIGKGCPVCAEMAADKKAGNKTKYSSSKSHAINFLTRSVAPIGGGASEVVNRVQILDKGNKVFEGLLGCMRQLGDLRNYDVTITRTGKDKGDTKYNVLPTFPPVALTDEEKALTLYNLDEISKDLTADQIKMFMNGATYEEVFKKDDAAPAADSGAAGLAVDFTRTA